MKNCRTCKWEPEEWDQEAPDCPEIGYCRAPIPFCVTEALIYLDGKGMEEAAMQVGFQDGVMTWTAAKGVRECSAWVAK